MLEEMLKKLKRRPEVDDDESDELLLDIIKDAIMLYATTRYSVTPYPVDDDGEPIVEKRYESWVFRAALEMYMKTGIIGQISSTENTTTRSFDSGSVSRGLLSEITPFAGVVR